MLNRDRQACEWGSINAAAASDSREIKEHDAVQVRRKWKLAEAKMERRGYGNEAERCQTFKLDRPFSLPIHTSEAQLLDHHTH